MANTPRDLFDIAERLCRAGRPMTALDTELRALPRRLEHADVSAIQLGASRILRILLRHAWRLGGDRSPERDGSLLTLQHNVRAAGKPAFSADFWHHADTVRRHSERFVDPTEDDVYAGSAGRALDWVGAVRATLVALEAILEEFARKVPAPRAASAKPDPVFDDEPTTVIPVHDAMAQARGRPEVEVEVEVEVDAEDERTVPTPLRSSKR